MNTHQTELIHSEPNGHRFALCRGVDYWAVAFAGREATFRHELGALYVAFLLLQPRQAFHGVALALKAREKLGQRAERAELIEQRAMGLEDAEAVRALWRHQRELERILEDRHEIEPVKAEALRELEEVTERLRTSPWLSRHGAERTVRAVAAAIWCFWARLAAAVDADGRPDEVLRAFAQHLSEHLLVPSGRGGAGKRDGAWAPPGCFIYVPPQEVVWAVQSQPSAECGMGTAESGIRDSKFEVRRSMFGHQPAAADYLARFLCAGFVLALVATGCTTRPLKGGCAVTTHTPSGFVEQALMQGENAAAATKQDQESVKVRTYTVPAGSRVEQAQVWEGERPREPKLLGSKAEIRAREDARPPGSQPSTVFTLSAPMPVVEREENRATTTLGAAQKDTARELGAKLASLKGITLVGMGLFVFGLASLVWPPLKVVIGSITTSGALMLGGLALMVLPSLVVGNELLILGVVALAVGGWALAHRHGHSAACAAIAKGQLPIAKGTGQAPLRESPIANAN